MADDKRPLDLGKKGVYFSYTRMANPAIREKNKYKGCIIWSIAS